MLQVSFIQDSKDGTFFLQRLIYYKEEDAHGKVERVGQDTVRVRT
jgi:hypothetical protein